MMDPNLKARWIRALRSHRYSQGYTFLERREKRPGRRDRVTNCCQGVLCRLARIPRGDAHDHVFSFDGDVWSLSPKLLRQFKLTPWQQSRLIELNDGYNGLQPHSFAEIADWLERNDRV